MADLYAADDSISTGKAIGGVLGIFVSLGIGLAILAFAAPFSLQNIGQNPTNAELVGAGVVSFGIGILPFFSILILSVLGGVWAGNVTRYAGPGALGGAVGSLLGAIVLLLLVGIGFALGVAAAGVDVGNLLAGAPNVNIPATLQNQIGFLLSTAGLLYLLVIAVTSAIAGAIVGAIRPHPYEGVAGAEERRPSPRV